MDVVLVLTNKPVLLIQSILLRLTFYWLWKSSLIKVRTINLKIELLCVKFDSIRMTHHHLVVHFLKLLLRILLNIKRNLTFLNLLVLRNLLRFLSINNFLSSCVFILSEANKTRKLRLSQFQRLILCRQVETLLVRFFAINLISVLSRILSIQKIWLNILIVYSLLLINFILRKDKLLFLITLANLLKLLLLVLKLLQLLTLLLLSQKLNQIVIWLSWTLKVRGQ